MGEYQVILTYSAMFNEERTKKTRKCQLILEIQQKIMSKNPEKT